MSKEDVNSNLVDPKRAAEFLRDEMLSMARRRFNVPWDKMSAGQQEDFAAALESTCKITVFHVVQAVAGAGREVVQATLGPLAVDKNGNPTSKVTFGKLEDADKIAIWDRIGRGIHVVLMDESEFQTYQSKIEIDQDQPELPGVGGKQPEWPVVAAALAKDAPAGDGEAPEVIDMDDEAQAEAAGLAAEEEEYRSPEPQEDDESAGDAVEDPEMGDGDSLLDDEDMSPEDVNKTVDIPNPTAPPTRSLKGPRPRQR